MAADLQLCKLVADARLARSSTDFVAGEVLVQGEIHVAWQGQRVSKGLAFEQAKSKFRGRCITFARHAQHFRR